MRGRYLFVHIPELCHNPIDARAKRFEPVAALLPSSTQTKMPSEKFVYVPDKAVSRNSYVSSFAHYKELYEKSVDNPEEFWGAIARQFYWETPINYDKFFRYNFDVRKGPIYTKWFDGATTNVSYNLLDRNVRNGLGDRVAFYWSVHEKLRSHYI